MCVIWVFFSDMKVSQVRSQNGKVRYFLPNTYYSCFNESIMFYLYVWCLEPAKKMPKLRDYKRNKINISSNFYPTAIKGWAGLVFTHGVRMGGRSKGQVVGKSLSRWYLRNHMV